MKKIQMCLAAVLLAGCSVAMGDTAPQANPQAAQQASQPAAQHEMAADQKSQEDAFKKQMEAFLMTTLPAPEHKVLEGMVGEFNAKVTIWNGPTAPGMSHVGTSHNTAVLGGRYVQENFTGEVMGAPFNGLGYVGYDTKHKQYVSFWIDNMSTRMMYGAQADETAPAIGESTAPADSFIVRIRFPREVWRLTIQKSQNDFSWEMWSPGPGGTMFKQMEIAYSRK